MPLGEYVTGRLFVLPTVGACLGSAYLLIRRFYRHLPPLPRGLALVTLATSVLLLAHVLPAAAGLLGRPAVLGVAVAVLAATWVISRPQGRGARDRDVPPPPSSPLSAILAVVAVGAAVVYGAVR